MFQCAPAGLPRIGSRYVKMDQNRLPNDDISFDRSDSVGAAVLSRGVGEQPLSVAGDTQPLPGTAVPLPAAQDGAACNHCQAPLANGQTLCRKCGFYATLNTFVEVEAESPVAAGDAVAQPKSHVDIWRSLIPAWGWALIAGVLALLAISVAARMLTPIGRPRAIWTYAQFGIGAAALVVAHVACYLFAIMHDSTLNFLDFVLKPFTVWSASCQDLPKSFKRVSLGLCSAGCWRRTLQRNRRLGKSAAQEKEQARGRHTDRRPGQR
jgi:hypothetical protein